MTRQHLLIALVALIAAAGLAYWFLETFELREEEFPTGYLGEARSNPYYAVRLMLREMGIDANKIDMPTLNLDLPPETATMVITTERSTLTEAKTQRLIDWVNQGGYLMVVSVEPEYYDLEEEEEPLAARDPLLEHLGIRAVYNHDAEWDTDVDALEVQTRDNDIKNLFIDFTDSYQLADVKNNDVTISSINGAHIIHRKLGQGAVTVMVDMDYFSNHAIGEEDHAEAFWEMLHWHHATGSKVFILHNDDMPSLLVLLWNNTRPVIIALGLLLFFWLANGLFRFGALIPQPQARRRSLMEHIEASGQFFWKDNQQHRLIQQTRHALSRRLSQLHPGWTDLTEKEREEHLSEMIQMPVDSVRQLLHSQETWQSQDFTRIIQQIENIRKQL